MDELDWLGPAGFVFQTPIRAKKHKMDAPLKRRRRKPSGGAGGALAKLARVVSRKPEVMVKVTGSARGFKSLKEHLAYITRNGKLIAERENGEEIEGSRNVKSLAEDWWSDAGEGRRKNARDTINLVLSMPPGTNRDAVAGAAKAFARSTFAGQFDYLLAVHDDTDHPHAHITVKTFGLQGQRLDPRKDDLQAWRERFAEALRARGVEAEATPRRARGVVKKGQKQAIRHLDARRASRVTRWKLEQAIKAAGSADETGELPWEHATKERQRKIRRAWGTIARALDGAGQVALSLQVKQFLDGLPAPVTEREQMLGQARKLVEQQRVQQPTRKK